MPLALAAHANSGAVVDVGSLMFSLIDLARQTR